MTFGSVQERLSAEVARPDGEIDLARGALLVAAAEYPELDVDAEMAALDSLAAAASRRLGGEKDALAQVNGLSQYLFDEVGLRGNREDYSDPRNSYLNEVLDRRLGIPITLSLVYVEVGRRLGMPLAGIGMPGHFVVRHRDITDLAIDAFSGGLLLSDEECAQRVTEATQGAVPWHPRYLEPVTKREFLARILRNLKGAYLRLRDQRRALRTMDLLLTVEPGAIQERRDRGMLRYQLGKTDDALEDLEGYLAAEPYAPDADKIKGLVQELRRKAP